MTTLKRRTLLLLLLMALANSGCENRATAVDDETIIEQPQQTFKKGNIDTHGSE